MNFVIYAPGDYTPNGGGCIALHKLAHNIASLGEKSYIMTSKKNPDYLGEQVTEQQAIELCKDGIAIYPEVTCGNPFKAQKVMRWILYYVRNYGEHGLFGATDLIYKFAPIYTLRNEQPVHGELRAMELQLKYFYDKGQERSGSCFLFKKTRPNGIVHPEGSIMLDSYYTMNGEDGMKWLSQIFNTCKTFYSYDNASWLSNMATLCGCTSIVIPDGTTTKEQWKEKFPYFKYGIAYGLDDLQHAESTKHLVKGLLEELEKETILQTKEFIKKSYEL